MQDHEISQGFIQQIPKYTRAKVNANNGRFSVKTAQQEPQ